MYALHLGDHAGAGLGVLSSSSADLPDHHRSSVLQQREFFTRDAFAQGSSRASAAAAAAEEEAYYRSASSNLSSLASSFHHRLDHPEVPPAEAVFLSRDRPRSTLERSTRASSRVDFSADRYQEHHIPNLWDQASTSSKPAATASIQATPFIGSSRLPEAQLLPPPLHHHQAISIQHDFNDAASSEHHRNPSPPSCDIIAPPQYRIYKTTAAININATSGASTSTAATITNTTSACKECGNQAKKDCQFQRCRTCCKSRSFDCQTHVKSTWVPAAHRRNRGAAAHAGGDAMIDSSSYDHESSGLPRSKRARGGGFRLVGSTASASSSGSQHDSDTPISAAFPAEVRAQAVFRCVKLTSVEDGEDEYAYQTTVRIGGHIFKGVLHDRGIEAGQQDSSSFGGTSTASHHLVAKSMAPSATVSAASDPALAEAAAAAATVASTATLYGHGGNVLLEEMRGGVGGTNW